MAPMMAFFQSIVALSLVASSVTAFNMASSTNLAVYWGQNSYGAVNSADTANWQKRLSYYCGSDSVIDTFPMAFLDVFFGPGGLPEIDLANTCNSNDDAVFPGSELPNCSTLAADIETCQAAGKIVTISIGGATGAVGFTSNAQAQTFATQIWNLFLGGSSSTRPFGSAVLDGVDLDIEGGGSTGYAAFVTQIRTLAAGASKKYYITGAPQCPFPDANLGAVINAVGFDAVYVQFYNNYCGTQAFSNPNDWNFGTWDNWAKTVSPNPAVKVYLGVPASSTAAGSGYVSASTLASIISATKSQYSSFGGVMMWDASQAYANGRYDIAAKNALTGSASPPPAPPPSSSSSKTTSTSSTKSSTSTSTKPSTTSTKTSTTTSSKPAPTSGSCAGVAAWTTGVAYVGGTEVTYGGHLWTAKWWSESDVPGGAAGDWQDDGPCSTIAIKSVDEQSKPEPMTAAPEATKAPSSKSSRFFRF